MTTPESLTEERLLLRELLSRVREVINVYTEPIMDIDLEPLRNAYSDYAAANLSPDVLGDQKDKGKATEYAPLGAAERDKPVEVSEPSAADKPTGTIFELDMFRERMERLAGERFSAERYDDLMYELAAELKDLIDNCQAQYCPNGAPNA